MLPNHADLRNTKFHNAPMLYSVFFTQERATEKPPDLHQWVHQRLPMTMDVTVYRWVQRFSSTVASADGKVGQAVLLLR
ncbi:MAG TPA: hypothetical protein VFA63_08760 [Pseudonocardiaceae bacterium]|nr:hypothetical protein [Pseudonocardiaceae bacterium]